MLQSARSISAGPSSIASNLSGSLNASAQKSKLLFSGDRRNSDRSTAATFGGLRAAATPKGSNGNVAVVERRLSDLRTASSSSASASSSSSSSSSPASFRRGTLQDESSPSSSGQFFTLTAKVTIRRKRNAYVNERFLEQVDCIADAAGQRVTLQLVSQDQLDPKTGKGKRSHVAALQGWSEKAKLNADKVVYLAEFRISRTFGTPGAIAIVNNHQNEFFLETIALDGVPTSVGPSVYFSCYSWVQSKFNAPQERVFFSNQVSLPSQTPPGLRDLREAEKASLRGNGRGIRKDWERVYDYDVYNDIGNPDKSKELARPTLGGTNKLPYPRRCRTGRLPTKTDAKAESILPMGFNYYVPRDEAFEAPKQENFISNTCKGAVHQLVPFLANALKNSHDEFQCFRDIDKLYQAHAFEARKLGLDEDNNGFLKDVVFPLANLSIKPLEESASQVSKVLQYERPGIVSRDQFAWLRDVEFGRQALAGVNPVNIQRLQEFPLRSTLDPEVYGSPDSAITADHIEGRLEGLTVEEAVSKGRLFILDYHDAYMPFVKRVNALEGRKMYASRTLFFLTAAGTMLPVAIELSLPPPSRGAPAKRRVFTPAPADASGYWEWQLAKAHVSSNDAGFHQLVNHWLRSHASVEPYIIATQRELSAMHPISKLLQPHFRYTLEINASARQLLINADGVIENCFTPGPFSLEISSAAYASMWRFDQEGLPADLVKRGMAVEDASQPNGLKLLVEDYPYAADGMLIWEAIKEWVDEYVSLYYQDEESVRGDGEIQAWWADVRERGHADKKDEAWWPRCDSPEDLKSILTTIIWVCSGFHAAVNFGQYAYGGYVPNRPCLTRRLIPEKGTPEYQEFARDPERFFLSALPNQQQATTLMAVVDTLSSHSPDEEYLGQRAHARWTADGRAMEAAGRFAGSMQRIEALIQERNATPHLKNRNGPGVLPYEFLVPTSGPGLTGRGVPNSISI